MDYKERVLPETYTRYTFKIDPPIVYDDEDVISHDVVLAHSEVEARRILINSYGTKFKRDYIITNTEEVTLFSNNYVLCEEDEVLDIPIERESYGEE